MSGTNRFRFRAWWPKKGKMYGPFALIGETTMFDLLNQMSIEELDEPDLMQSTGLTDSAGVDVFEGDVARLACDSYSEKLGRAHREWITTVVYSEPRAQFLFRHKGLLWTPDARDFNGLPFTYTVIGNIYEHPQLHKEAS